MRNARSVVFQYLSQMGETAPVKLSIGAVLGGIVRPDYVVVHDAPSRIVHEIVTGFRGVSLTADGLLIPLIPETDGE